MGSVEMIITTSPLSHEDASSVKSQIPLEPSTGQRSRRDCVRDSSVTVDGFIQSINRFYRTLNRAEDRKRFLSAQLPTCIKVRSTTSPFMFYNSTDNERLEAEIVSVKKNPGGFDLTRIDRIIHGIKCRVRKKPMSPTLSSTQISIIRAVRNITVAFNRITYIARIKHYCDRESRISNYLRDQLTKRCSENSKLTTGIRRLLMCIGVDNYRDLAMILTGILCQTPHMWARSIRLLVRLKVFCQNLFIKMFYELNIDLRDVFELSYHTASQRLLLQVRQYGASVFTLNQTQKERIPIKIESLGRSQTKHRKRRASRTASSLPSEPLENSSLPSEPLNAFNESPWLSPAPPPLTPCIRTDDEKDLDADELFSEKSQHETLFSIKSEPMSPAETSALPNRYIIFNDTLLTDTVETDRSANDYIFVSLSPRSPDYLYREESDAGAGITIQTNF
nr:MAG: protein m34 [Herpesviridae sp.]